MSPMLGRRKSRSAPPTPPAEASPKQERLLTSKDLFGDMVDAVDDDDAVDAVPARPAARSGPIRVQVSEPGREPAAPRAADGSALLPADVAALLDAAFQPVASSPTGPVPTPADAPPASAKSEDASLDILGQMIEPDASGGGAAAPAAARTQAERDAESARFRARVAKSGPPEEVDLAAVVEGAFRAAEKRRGRAPLKLPRTFGPYTLLDRVAIGGMAEVYRAKRAGVEGFEKIVAVKRILPHLSDNKEFVDMFIDEAKMVAGLTHPSIVQIYDLGRIDQAYYIAMEYVHGRDLRTILRRVHERGMRLPLDLSLLIVGRVCAALDYAHKKRDEAGRAMNIVHRDVSPQNIMIAFEGDVKLTDFGIAKAATKARSTDTGTLRGKLLYMSPEQAWGKPMDRRSDLFSLGLVFYEMITDQKPFMAGSESNVLEMVRECRIAAPTTLNPRIPDRLERVVMKALARDPENRYQEAGEMSKDLDRTMVGRQPPTNAELARYLEILFDEDERGATRSLDGEDEADGLVSRLEVELDASGSDPGSRMAASSAVPTLEDSSVESLIKRLGIK
jgi:serine/threonine protein kinase